MAVPYLWICFDIMKGDKMNLSIGYPSKTLDVIYLTYLKEVEPIVTIANPTSGLVAKTY